jgi:hypothetical protein
VIWNVVVDAAHSPIASGCAAANKSLSAFERAQAGRVRDGRHFHNHNLEVEGEEEGARSAGRAD